jgi:uncharacterized protein
MTSEQETLKNFKCKRCGNCCKWPGIVRLSDEDINQIAAFLNLCVEEFIEQYTKLSPDRRCLILTDNEQGGCVFYTEPPPGCIIQQVKPIQCGNFPEKWRTKLWHKSCAGAKNKDSD